VKPWPDRGRLLVWLQWAACAVLILGAVIALVVPRGGENRIAPVAVPFGIAAAALAAISLMPRTTRWVTAALYAAAGLGASYGVLVAAAVPLRLSVESSCAPAPAPCPLGYDRPLSSAENFALEAAVACGILALLLVFFAAELRYRPRITLFGPARPPEGDTKPDS
jgi:hypothetical protein